MDRMRWRMGALVLLAVLCCTSSAQTPEDDALLAPGGADAFMYDPMQDMEQPGDVAAIIAQHRVVSGLADVTDRTYGCRVAFRDWPCRRKRVLDIEFPVTISDVLPIRSDQAEERALYIDGVTPSPFDAFLSGPTPPPTPHGILDANDLARIRAMAASGDPAILDGDGDNLGLQSPATPSVAFDANAVEWAYRNLLWQGIEDFTSFAPADRVLHGGDVVRVIEKVAAGGPTECVADCPTIVRKPLGTRDTLYSYCVRAEFQGLGLPPTSCTPIAFVVDGQAWLRTRLVFRAAEGRGSGPFEYFRCESDKSVAASVAALASMFKSRFKSDTRTRAGAGSTRLVAVTWRDRASEVAANRWEIFYFDGVVQAQAVPGAGGRTRTVLEYQIPIYRLSDSRPTSIDVGLTPREEIVRSFERALRRHLTEALAPATCTQAPVEWGA